MRTIEEIKADIKRCKLMLFSENLSGYRRYSLEDSINGYEGQLRLALTDDIPLSRLEEICNAERDGMLFIGGFDWANGSDMTGYVSVRAALKGAEHE